MKNAYLVGGLIAIICVAIGIYLGLTQLNVDAAQALSERTHP